MLEGGGRGEEVTRRIKAFGRACTLIGTLHMEFINL